MSLAMKGSVMRPLHDDQTIFSSRHVPSWLLLAAAGGTVNAIGFVAHARFVSHVTGTISSVGMEASAGKLAVESAFILGCLVLGAMSATPLVGGGDGRAPRHALPLVLVAGILAALAGIGAAGAFGTFGDDNEARNFVFLSVLSFTMGLQNAAVAAATRLVVRTTHMTGAATDLGMHLGIAFRSDGEARRAAFRQAALRAGKIAAFTIGAAGGAVLAAKLGFFALAFPAVAVGCATVASFVGSPAQPRDARARSASA